MSMSELRNLRFLGICSLPALACHQPSASIGSETAAQETSITSDPPNTARVLEGVEEHSVDRDGVDAVLAEGLGEPAGELAALDVVGRRGHGDHAEAAAGGGGDERLDHRRLAVVADGLAGDRPVDARHQGRLGRLDAVGVDPAVAVAAKACAFDRMVAGCRVGRDLDALEGRGRLADEGVGVEAGAAELRAEEGEGVVQGDWRRVEAADRVGEHVGAEAEDRVDELWGVGAEADEGALTWLIDHVPEVTFGARARVWGPVGEGGEAAAQGGDGRGGPGRAEHEVDLAALGDQAVGAEQEGGEARVPEVRDLSGVDRGEAQGIEHSRTGPKAPGALVQPVDQQRLTELTALHFSEQSGLAGALAAEDVTKRDIRAEKLAPQGGLNEVATILGPTLAKSSFEGSAFDDGEPAKFVDYIAKLTRGPPRFREAVFAKGSVERPYQEIRTQISGCDLRSPGWFALDPSEDREQIFDLRLVAGEKRFRGFTVAPECHNDTGAIERTAQKNRQIGARGPPLLV